MSLSMLLIPMSIAVVTTIMDAAEHINNHYSANANEIQNVPTKFINQSLLMKTLDDHGIRFTQTDDNTIICDMNDSQIIYHRNSQDEPFLMGVKGHFNMEQLMCNIKAIETEFDGNLQTYSYNRVMNNIPEGMHLESEEILEDDSIIITLGED